MLRNKPWLIIYSIFYLLLWAVFILYDIIRSLIAYVTNASGYLLIVHSLIYLFLYLLTVIGILARKKWSRILSILIYIFAIYVIYDTYNIVLRYQKYGAYSHMLKPSSVILNIILVSLSIIGLYSMIFAKSVKEYYNNKQ